MQAVGLLGTEERRTCTVCIGSHGEVVEQDGEDKQPTDEQPKPPQRS